MKKKIINWMTIFMVVVLSVGFVSCSSDDDDATVSKSEIVGTWYTMEDGGGVLVITETSLMVYEILKSEDLYFLNDNAKTWSYSIKGHQLINEFGESVTISVNGNTLKVSKGNKMQTYSKFDGTLQQLIDYLNKK